MLRSGSRDGKTSEVVSKSRALQVVGTLSEVDDGSKAIGSNKLAIDKFVVRFVSVKFEPIRLRIGSIAREPTLQSETRVDERPLGTADSDGRFVVHQVRVRNADRSISCDSIQERSTKASEGISSTRDVDECDVGKSIEGVHKSLAQETRGRAIVDILLIDSIQRSSARDTEVHRAVDDGDAGADTLVELLESVALLSSSLDIENTAIEESHRDAARVGAVTSDVVQEDRQRSTSSIVGRVGTRRVNMNDTVLPVVRQILGDAAYRSIDDRNVMGSSEDDTLSLRGVAVGEVGVIESDRFSNDWEASSTESERQIANSNISLREVEADATSRVYNGRRTDEIGTRNGDI